MKPSNMITLLLKLPRNTEVTPEAAQTFLAALTGVNPNTTSFFNVFSGSNAKPLALEIVLTQGRMHFQISCDKELVPFIETQIQSNYPLAVIEKYIDPLTTFDTSKLNVAYLKLRQGDYYPIKTYPTFKDIDPMSSLLSVLAKAPPEETAIIQYALEGTNGKWQEKGNQFADYGEKNADGSYKARPDASVIKEKTAQPGFQVSVRIATTTEDVLKDLTSAYDVFTKADGNSLAATYPTKAKVGKEIEYLLSRKVADKQIFNVVELATLWHLPSEKVKTPSIVWGNSVLSEPPHNLPIALDLSPAEKTKINFFAKTVYKNQETVFGIKDQDRLRHIWTVGKTGTGKSTMIANMAIDDVRKDRGLAIIDPHGDLCEDVLDYIPGNRINDTIYFNPADREYPISLNPLEVTNREEAELVVAGLMSIFTKVWANVWSARMEYILRNSFLTLTEVPNSTLADVLKLLADQSYRNRVVSKLEDQTLVHFWKDEFDVMPEKLQKEAISPIQNKVGQFVTSPMIRRIIGTPKSSISIDDIMDQRKILLVNLSQGRLGEDNSALLGAMLITKFQLAAMHRVDVEKEDRVPFYLYVDEFQNFATNSFVKILSEARKYGLALTLANQYMAQIPEPVTKAILGNAGTMISFAVGADDAKVFHKEFAEVFSENDIVSLENYQIAIKLMIDWHATRPFFAKTLPLPESKSNNREKVIKVSRERYAKAIKKDAEKEAEEAKDAQAPPNNSQSEAQNQHTAQGASHSMAQDTTPVSQYPSPTTHNQQPTQQQDLANRIIPAPTVAPLPPEDTPQDEREGTGKISPEIKEGKPPRVAQNVAEKSFPAQTSLPADAGLPAFSRNPSPTTNYPTTPMPQVGSSFLPPQNPLPAQPMVPYTQTAQQPIANNPRPTTQYPAPPQPLPRQTNQQPMPQQFPQQPQGMNQYDDYEEYDDMDDYDNSPLGQQGIPQPMPYQPRPMGHYPPPPPAIDPEIERQKREAQKQEEDARIADLKAQLAGLSRPPQSDTNNS